MTDKQPNQPSEAKVETQADDSNPYGNLEADPAMDAPHEFYCEISDEQIIRMQDEIDSIIDAKSDETTEELDLDPSSNLLPPSIRRALRRRMPREAIQRFANMTPVVDADGNQALVKERAVRIHAVVVDYLADKIFGERLNFEILEHGITKAKDENIIIDLHTGVKPVYQVIAWAKVRCTVLRNDGTLWTKEDKASMAAEVEGKGANPAKAHRIAEMGAVTAARRRALQQYGRVFGGFDIRDMENTIGSIKEKQKLQEASRAQLDANAASQEKSFSQDSRSGTKSGKAKPALAIDPALKAQTAVTDGVTPSQPGAKLAETAKTAPKSGSGKPKVQPQVAPKPAKTGAAQFLYRAQEDTEPAVITVGEMFAKSVVKLINKAKDQTEADRAIFLNREGIALLEKDPRWAHTVQAIQTAHEVKKALFDSRAKKAQNVIDRRAATKRKKENKARTDAAAQAVDAAVAEASDASTSNTEALVLANTPDHAGFGGPSAPIVIQPAEASETPAALSDWTPVLLALELDENGKAKNIHGYGQSVLEAVRNAPTIADLDRFLEQVKDDMSKLNKEAVSFINSTADQRRKVMTPK